MQDQQKGKSLKLLDRISQKEAVILNNKKIMEIERAYHSKLKKEKIAQVQNKQCEIAAESIVRYKSILDKHQHIGEVAKQLANEKLQISNLMKQESMLIQNELMKLA